MVRFRWLVKTSKHAAPHSEKDAYSPPQYQEGDHAEPSVFPGPSMSTIPTASTTQATHFLSLPLCRKRQEQQVDPLRRQSMSDALTHQPGSDRQLEQEIPTPKEKSLPPTPTSSTEGASGAHLCRVNSPIEGPSSPYRPRSRQALQSATASPTARPSPSQAKVALAQAALAIGLPHGMPQASASSSLSDVNSIAFVTIPQSQSNRHGFPPSSIRRTKSFQQLTRYGKDDTHPDSQLSRSRGISYGHVNAFDPNEKGKGKAMEDIPSHITPPRKSLVRRASFWNRKRHDSKSSVAPLPSQHPHNSVDHLSHMLPSLPPMSPFHIDNNTSHSSRSSHTEEQLPPGLNSRRDRPLPPRPATSSPDLSLQPSQPHPPRRRRPATADSAADRPRTLSFASSSGYLSRLAPAPSRPAPSQRSDTATSRQRPRPRSQTNPQFLRRLSANLFSFGSSSPSPSPSGAIGPYLTHFPGASPRASTSKLPPPKPRPDLESPASYVNRLLSTISKVEIASALANRCDILTRQLESRT
jgi:hypothetical protein